MDVGKYLTRIGAAEPLGPDASTLAHLQRRHLLNVPFENLDIHWKRPIVLDTEQFYRKIVAEKRGGFCYELNGLFNQLLQALGFDTYLVSARVFNGATHGPEFDHAAVIVRIGDEKYLSDVGFGDFAAAPLRLAVDEEQRDATGTYTVRRIDDAYLEVAKRMGDAWKSEYIFRDSPRRLSEFVEMCDFQQYSPESHFTKGKLCSLLTSDGRKTLTDMKFISTTGGAKNEVDVGSSEEFDTLLMREFGITAV